MNQSISFPSNSQNILMLSGLSGWLSTFAVDGSFRLQVGDFQYLMMYLLAVLMFLPNGTNELIYMCGQAWMDWTHPSFSNTRIALIALCRFPPDRKDLPPIARTFWVFLSPDSQSFCTINQSIDGFPAFSNFHAPAPFVRRALDIQGQQDTERSRIKWF